MSSLRLKAAAGTALAVVIAAFGAHVALARHAAPAGTGVVDIWSTLGFQSGAAAGTGIVLTANGEVLTNNHVIQGSTKVTVSLPGSAHRYTAKVLGYDPSDDVAVLKVSGVTNLQTATAGNSASLSVRDQVTAIGNAGGTGRLSSASGTVTGLGKAITAQDDEGNAERLTGLIETNAGLQPGDSGGPLYDANQKVIGMDTAASAGTVFEVSAEDAYAIPINHALAIAKQIVAGQGSAKVHIGGTAFLGVSIETSNGFDFGVPQVSGQLVQAVVSGSPAARIGLQASDVITAIDGHAVATQTALRSLLLRKAPGAKVTVTWVDQTGATHRVAATLASGPAE